MNQHTVAKTIEPRKVPELRLFIIFTKEPSLSTMQISMATNRKTPRNAPYRIRISWIGHGSSYPNSPRSIAATKIVNRTVEMTNATTSNLARDEGRRSALAFLCGYLAAIIRAITRAESSKTIYMANSIIEYYRITHRASTAPERLHRRYGERTQRRRENFFIRAEHEFLADNRKLPLSL